MDITKIVEAVITLLCAVITCIVIPLIKSKTTLSQRQELIEWVKIAVTAAEQLYRGSGRGAEKKKYVLEWLAQRNIKVDEAEIDAMIESAVHEMNASMEESK